MFLRNLKNDFIIYSWDINVDDMENDSARKTNQVALDLRDAIVHENYAEANLLMKKVWRPSKLKSFLKQCDENDLNDLKQQTLNEKPFFTFLPDLNEEEIIRDSKHSRFFYIYDQNNKMNEFRVENEIWALLETEMIDWKNFGYQ